MTRVGKSSTMHHYFCGQKIEVQEVHSGYLMWPRFLVDGERVSRCPKCGMTLVIDHLVSEEKAQVKEVSDD